MAYTPTARDIERNRYLEGLRGQARETRERLEATSDPARRARLERRLADIRTAQDALAKVRG